MRLTGPGTVRSTGKLAADPRPPPWTRAASSPAARLALHSSVVGLGRQGAPPGGKDAGVEVKLHLIYRARCAGGHAEWRSGGRLTSAL